jgi:inhibitor of KinA sporulation pathway (predicted exonuclease)
MSKKLDQVVIVDLEATCWSGEPTAGEVSEIIEIGVCLLELSTGRLLDNRGLLIRPTRSTVSPFCTQLTTLTQEQVDGGIDFAEACQILKRDYKSKDRLWASFGDYDRTMFQKQCDAVGVPYPFGPRHLNAKTLYALSKGLIHEVGLAEAYALEGETLSGTHHRGGDDAFNIAGLLGKLLRKLRTAE